jgi:SAM-dependent methyltransferase
MKFLKTIAKVILPAAVRKRLGLIQRRLVHFGLVRYCPCCRSFVRHFLPFGYTGRANARCPICGSLERHRMILLYLRNKTNLFDAQPKKMLHVAPEEQLAGIFQSTKSIEYISVDLLNPQAMFRMDLCDLDFPDSSFDLIFCLHVLDHIPDDCKAMKELFRVLKPGGWAILQVAITVDRTLEDSTITSEEDRLRVFGQPDRVRRYGLDYVDRLAKAGFEVNRVQYARQLNDRTVRRIGLLNHEWVFHCVKSATGNP